MRCGTTIDKTVLERPGLLYLLIWGYREMRGGDRGVQEGCFKDPSRKLRGRLKDPSRSHQGSFKGAPRLPGRFPTLPNNIFACTYHPDIAI